MTENEHYDKILPHTLKAGNRIGNHFAFEHIVDNYLSLGKNMPEKEHFDKILPCSCRSRTMDSAYGPFNREFRQVWLDRNGPLGYNFECMNCKKQKHGWVNDKRWTY